MEKYSQDDIIIEVKNVRKSFKKVQAVKEISLTIHKDEFVALLGPNGAGKTTLVEMIEGIQKPDAGEILIKGMHWKHHSQELHNIIGLSLQETKFFDKLTTYETLELFASFYKLKKQRIDEILDLVNLTEKRKSFVVNLSGGQRQKLALGISILNEPQILLLDEPTTGLDPVARREIWQILLNLKTEFQTSLILTTHYMEEAQYLCPRIIIMDEGTILAQGSLDQLLSDRECGQVIEFSFNNYFGDFEYAHDDNKLIWDKVQKSGKLIVTDISKQLPAFINYVQEKNLTFNNFQCRKTTLDDLFVSLTGKRLEN